MAPRQTTGVRPLVGLCVHDWSDQVGVFSVHARAWTEWSASLRIRYDAGMLTADDVVNLIARVGLQVGVGEGRPDSKQSAGLGFGLFEIA